MRPCARCGREMAMEGGDECLRCAEARVTALHPLPSEMPEPVVGDLWMTHNGVRQVIELTAHGSAIFRLPGPRLGIVEDMPLTSFDHNGLFKLTEDEAAIFRPLFGEMEEEEEVVAPDLVGAIAAYREWHVDLTKRADPALASAGAGEYDWKPGTNQAECFANPIAAMAQAANSLGIAHIFGKALEHQAPVEGCTCGLYALHDPPSIPFPQRATEDLIVTGVVRAWGNLEVHASGVRAEYAEVLAIGSNSAPRRKVRAVLDKLAEKYECEVLPDARPATLEAFGREAGGTVPMSLRPEGPKEGAMGQRPVLRNYERGRAAIRVVLWFCFLMFFLAIPGSTDSLWGAVNIVGAFFCFRWARQLRPNYCRGFSF